MFVREQYHTNEFFGIEGSFLGVSNITKPYRYGFNGMEKDDEVKGSGNSYTTEFRQYDPRLGKWLSIDPLFQEFPWQSPYVAFDNNPIYYKDPKGLAAEGNGDDEKEKSEPKNDKISKRELKRAGRYARNQDDRTEIYEYEKDGRVRYGVKTYHSESSVDENGDVTVIGSMEDVKFNRVANWWSSVFHGKGIIVWGDGHGGNDTYGGHLKDFDKIETIELSEINDLINAGKGKSTTRPKLNKSQATKRGNVYKRVGDAMREDAKRSGTGGNENKNKSALKKSDHNDVKIYFIPDPKNPGDSIRVVESEYGVDYRKPLDNGVKTRSWSQKTDKDGN